MVSILKRKHTSRALTRPLTLLAMLAAWASLDASFIRVTRKFLHFFTLSRVSCQWKTVYNLHLVNAKSGGGERIVVFPFNPKCPKMTEKLNLPPTGLNVAAGSLAVSVV